MEIEKIFNTTAQKLFNLKKNSQQHLQNIFNNVPVKSLRNDCLAGHGKC